jgi:hypothetical protein
LRCSTRSKCVSHLGETYFEALTRVARKRLGDRPRRTADEEDLALSAFQCLCDGAKNGRFEGHMDRTDLWKLLLVITRQKVADHVRRVSAAKRGSGRISGESVFLAGGDDLSRYGIEHIAAEAPTPELLASLNEEFHRLMDLLHGQGDPRPPARFCRRVLGLGATTNSPQAQSRSPWNRVRAFQRPAGAFWGRKPPTVARSGLKSALAIPRRLLTAPGVLHHVQLSGQSRAPRRSIATGFANIRLNRPDRSTSDYRR